MLAFFRIVAVVIIQALVAETFRRKYELQEPQGADSTQTSLSSWSALIAGRKCSTASVYQQRVQTISSPPSTFLDLGAGH